MNSVRWSLILLHFILCPVAFSQIPEKGPDYKTLFGKDYDYASSTIGNNTWWTDSLEKTGIDPQFALSIIFPELIRYSSISDYIEIKALEVLYVQYGHDYADFSIGLFQVKPSFAELIEADLLQYHLLDSFPSLSSLKPKVTDDVQTRKERIFKLKDEHFQLKYLEAFIRVMDHLYQGIYFGSTEEKLIFYATAYNTGYFKGEKVIKGASDKAYFHCGIAEPEIKYSYSAIALDYYCNQ